MLNVLVSDHLSPEVAAADDLYGWLVGSWDVAVSDLQPDGAWRESRGEWHFARVLEGRAIEDVFIVPRLDERRSVPDAMGNRFGASLRHFDRALGAWRVTWVNPVSGARNDLVGRRDGGRIVQEGTGADGRPIRWIFSDITDASFLWTGETRVAETADGWLLEAEFRARRRA